MSGYDILCTIIAIFLPPLAVFMKRGLHRQFWFNCLWTLLGFIPGIIHALYVIYKYPHLHHWPAGYGPSSRVGSTTPVV